MTEYRIIEDKYYDEKGILTSTSYSIKIKSKFLFWEYWKYIKHTDCGWGGDSYKVITKFETLEDAQKFANECICGDTPFSGWETKIVVENKC